MTNNFQVAEIIVYKCRCLMRFLPGPFPVFDKILLAVKLLWCSLA